MAETDEYRFSDVGGALCLDYANTISSYNEEGPNEHLNSYSDLLKWGTQRGVLSDTEARELEAQAEQHPEEAANVLKSALEMRLGIYRVFSAVAPGQVPTDEAMDIFNSYLSRALSHARVVEEGSSFAW